MMKISSSQNKRTQVASDKTDEASKIGQLSKGAGSQTVGVVRTGDRFEIAKNPSVFDQLTGGNGRAPLWGQGVERPARDPNHAADGVRHDHPAVNPSLDGNDPRGDLERGSLERETVVDVAATTPGGHNVEQSLPTGLDGKPIRTGPHHQINDLGDKFLDGRSGDSNSPGNMQRDPLAAGEGTPDIEEANCWSSWMQRDPLGAGEGTGSSGSPQGGWRDGTKSIEGNAGGGHGKGNAESKSGGTLPTPPPGTELSFRAPNMGLVSGDKDSADDGSFWDHPIDNTAKAINNSYKGGGTTDLPPDGGTKRPDGDTAVPRPKPKPVRPGSSDDYMTDPDAGAATTLTEEQLARAIAVHGGDTNPVEGHGAGPQIEGDAPMIRNGDLVRDPNPEDEGRFDVSTGTTTPPGQEISKTLNPSDGLGSELPPSPGPGTGGGGTGNPIDA